MTNVEIDDVLSSIRRLVSEEKPKKPAVAPDNDRFVLTPALRVMDEAVSTAPARDGMASPVTSDPAAPLELTQYLATPTPAAQTPPEPAAPPVSSEYRAMEQAWQSELARVSAKGPARQPAGGEAASSAETNEPMSLETRIAELEAAVSMAGEEWEPDGSEPGFGQPPRHHIFEVVDNTARDAAAPDDHRGASVADEQAAQDTDGPAEPAEPAVEMAFFSHAAPPPEAPETAHAPAPPPPEDVAKAPAPAAADAVTPPEPAPDPVIMPEMDVAPDTRPDRGHDPIPFPTPGDVVEDDDVFLDVEALREMISDVVRSELQGKMGETITRNVRRMVQQEIARALTHQDPDAD